MNSFGKNRITGEVTERKAELLGVLKHWHVGKGRKVVSIGVNACKGVVCEKCIGRTGINFGRVELHVEL